MGCTPYFHLQMGLPITNQPFWGFPMVWGNPHPAVVMASPTIRMCVSVSCTEPSKNHLENVQKAAPLLIKCQNMSEYMSDRMLNMIRSNVRQTQIVYQQNAKISDQTPCQMLQVVMSEYVRTAHTQLSLHMTKTCSPKHCTYVLHLYMQGIEHVQ